MVAWLAPGQLRRHQLADLLNVDHPIKSVGGLIDGDAVVAVQQPRQHEQPEEGTNDQGLKTIRKKLFNQITR